MCRYCSAMELAMGASDGGSVEGTAATQRTDSSSVSEAACGKVLPASVQVRARSFRRDPPHAGQGRSTRNFDTRASPFSSLALASAFSTV